MARFVDTNGQIFEADNVADVYELFVTVLEAKSRYSKKFTQDLEEMSKRIKDELEKRRNDIVVGVATEEVRPGQFIRTDSKGTRSTLTPPRRGTSSYGGSITIPQSLLRTVLQKKEDDSDVVLDGLRDENGVWEWVEAHPHV